MNRGLTQVGFNLPRIKTLMCMLLALVSVGCELSITSIAANTYTLAAIATYNVTILHYPTPTLTNLSTLSFLFNSQNYQGLISNPVCSSPDLGISSLPCTTTGTTITVSGLFTNSKYNNNNVFTIMIANIRNPSPAKDYTPITNIQIQDTSYSQSGTVTQTITITPVAATCSITSIASGLAFYSGGKISIAYNSAYISGNTNSSYFLNIAMDSYYSDDSTESLINPTFTANVEDTQSVGSAYIYSINYTKNFTVTMLMPPSTKSETSFIQLTSYDKNNLGSIDTCSITISGIQANTFTSASVSTATVQTLATLKFILNLPTPLTSGDYLLLLFDASFDLSSVNSGSVSISGYNTNFPLIKLNSSLLELTASLSQPALEPLIVFSISGIKMPFTSKPAPITMSVKTFDNYYRINQVYSYTALTGNLGVTMLCQTYQIGTTTTCIVSLSNISMLTSDATIRFQLPSAFPVSDGSYSCPTSGLKITSAANCITTQSSQLIQAKDFNISTSNINVSSLTLNVTLTMSQLIGNYTITVSTTSQGSVVDSGTVAITTVTRVLTTSQLSLVSTSSTTYSATNYILSIALPFDLGYLYTMTLNIPVDSQNTPSITNANSMSYSNQTITATVASLLNSSFTITNLLTPISLQPITTSFQLSYQGVVYFTASRTLTMSVLKTISPFTVTQSNQIVYKPFTATLSLGNLQAGDKIRLSTPFPLYFYSNDQTNCGSTNSNVSCGGGGLVTVNSANFNATTVFSVELVNQAFLGSYNLAVTVYDSSNVYGKQTGNYLMSVTTYNIITITASQNNPYLSEASIYKFNLTLSTPNSTILSVSVSTLFANVTASCNMNCAVLSSSPSTGTYLLSITSMQMVLSFSLTNPTSFNNLTTFQFTTSGNDGSKDLGLYQPTLLCSSPCRSCSTTSPSLCLTCYVWSSSPYFYSNTCLGSCPNATYATTSNSVLSCLSCASTCTACSQTSTNCSSCILNYYLYNAACYSSCPVGTLTVSSNFTCLPCTAPCLTCSNIETNCTSCMISFNGSLYFYLSNRCYSGSCPQTYYVATTDNSCGKCNNTCYTCTASSCLTCNNPQILYNGLCYTTCPTGSFSSSNGTLCTDCPAVCQACQNATVCTVCTYNYYLMSGSCLSVCPSYFFGDGSGVCSPCTNPCLLCNSTGCITCSNSSYYLQGQACMPTCSKLHPNNVSMVCQDCISPCNDCSWSNTCTTCISGYSFLNTTCLAVCPTGYYSNNVNCLTCPSNCSACDYVNLQISCSSCNNGYLIYSYDCIETCPSDSQPQGKYCVSANCSSLSHCVVCSGYRCLQCSSLYTLSANYTCDQVVNKSQVIAALSSIPVPFPFLIAIIMVIIISFFLKHNFQKMFSPLFIYAIAGVLEELCLIMWNILAILWNTNVNFPLPLVSVVYTPALILIGYCLLNVVQFICWRCIIATDRKYQLWERQDNRSASLSMGIFSLLLSFRFNALIFSRTGHSQKLSAKLSAPEKFRYYSVLAVLGMVMNGCSIAASVYVSYLQSSMNYLFFTGLQVAVVSVLMIALSIVMLCVPKEHLIEDRGQYRFGHDSDKLEGPSLQEVLSGLGVVEEYHSHGEVCSESGSAVMRKNDYVDNQSNSQDITLLKAPDKLEIEEENSNIDDDIKFEEEGGVQATPARKQPSIFEDQIFALSETPSSQNHILIDQIESNRVEAIQLAKKYIPIEKEVLSTFPRQAGAITRQRQRLYEIQESPSDSSYLGEYEEYTLNYPENQWTKLNKFSEQQKLSQSQEERKRISGDQWIKRQQQRKLQEEKLEEKNRIEAKKYEQEEKIMRQSEKKKEEEILRQTRQIQKEMKEQKQEQKRLKQLKRKEDQRQKIIKQKEEEEKKKQLQLVRQQQRIKQRQKQEEDRTRREQERIKAEEDRLRRQQERKLQEQLERQRKLEENKKSIDKLNELNRILAQLEEQQHNFESTAHQLQVEEVQLSRKQKEQAREQAERRLMSIQDKLSKTASIFQQMYTRQTETRPRNKKIPRENIEAPQIANQIQYNNEDISNLADEVSPKKVKVNPLPLPVQYKRQHIFVEEGNEILSSDGDQESLTDNMEIVFETNGSRVNMPEDKRVEKPKSVLRRNQTAKRRPQLPNQMYQPKASELQPVMATKQTARPQLGQKLEAALAPVHYQQFNSQFYSQDEQQEQPIPLDSSHAQTKKEMQFDNNRNIQVASITQNQISVYNQDIIQVQSSGRSINSNSDSHWPMQPEMEQRIREIQRRADNYINYARQPVKKEPSRDKYIFQTPTDEIYEQSDETDKQTLGEIVFEQSQQIISSESLMRNSTKKRFPLGRVNRHVIDLSPKR